MQVAPVARERILVVDDDLKIVIEFSMLAAILRARERVLFRDQLTESIGAADADLVLGRSVDVYDAFSSLGEEADRLHRLYSSPDALTEDAELPTVMADIDVSGAVTDAANIARPALGRQSVHLTDRIQPGLRGRANSDRLAQILHNLRELPKLWDRFYRVEKSRDRASGGAGIGLAIVKELVESAGGKVGVESGLGRNRFWFTIPAD